MILGRVVGTPVGDDVAVMPEARLCDVWKIMVDGSHICVALSVPVSTLR